MLCDNHTKALQIMRQLMGDDPAELKEILAKTSLPQQLKDEIFEVVCNGKDPKNFKVEGIQINKKTEEEQDKEESDQVLTSFDQDKEKFWKFIRELLTLPENSGKVSMELKTIIRKYLIVAYMIDTLFDLYTKLERETLPNIKKIVGSHELNLLLDAKNLLIDNVNKSLSKLGYICIKAE